MVPAFVSQQPGFHLQPACKPRQRARRADHAMARHDDAHRVLAVRQPHGAGLAGIARSMPTSGAADRVAEKLGISDLDAGRPAAAGDGPLDPYANPAGVNEGPVDPYGEASGEVPPRGADLGEMLEVAGRLGLEGVVAKRRGSPYRPGTRSTDWRKLRLLCRQEFVVGGFTDPRGARIGLGALLVGYYDRDDLVFAGKVGKFNRPAQKSPPALLPAAFAVNLITFCF